MLPDPVQQQLRQHVRTKMCWQPHRNTQRPGRCHVAPRGLQPRTSWPCRRRCPMHWPCMCVHLHTVRTLPCRLRTHRYTHWLRGHTCCTEDRAQAHVYARPFPRPPASLTEGHAVGPGCVCVCGTGGPAPPRRPTMPPCAMGCAGPSGQYVQQPHTYTHRRTHIACVRWHMSCTRGCAWAV